MAAADGDGVGSAFVTPQLNKKAHRKRAADPECTSLDRFDIVKLRAAFQKQIFRGRLGSKKESGVPIICPKCE